MGYYVRIFCKSNTIPKIRDIFDYVRNNGFSLKLNPSNDLDNSEWNEFFYTYKENKKPILVDLVKNDNELFKAEITEFIEEIGNAFLSSAKSKVLTHLKNTNYIVTTQLPTEDIDDDGYNANGEFLKYFVRDYEGMIQADGEGFYEGYKVIVKTS